MPRPSKGARLWYDKTAGLWFIRDGASKRSTGAALGDRPKADAALAAYITAKYEPTREATASKVPVAQVLSDYFDAAQPRQRSAAVVSAFKALYGWWGSKTLADVKRSTCLAYIAHRTAQGHPQAKRGDALDRRLKPTTAARELAVLRAAIRLYHSETPLDALPVVTLPPRGSPRTRWLTRSEAARLLWATRSVADRDAGKALARFILLGLYTGTRSGAIRALRWEPSPDAGSVDLQ